MSTCASPSFAQEFNDFPPPSLEKVKNIKAQIDWAGIRKKRQERTVPLEIWTPEEIWKRSLLAKVHGLIPWQVEEHLQKCGVEEIFRTCEDCGRADTFYYRCNLKFCPLCNWRIARARTKLLQHWVRRIQQPKHVVLTSINSKFITRSRIRAFGKAIARLRRMKLWREVKGGCCSIEITNEGRGWHLHAHMLLDVRWLDASDLAIQWAKCIGQEFAIVKVKDVRGNSYLGEITKYVVKAAQLASWEENEIAQFIHAIRGVRFFATFGSMFKIRQEIAAEILSEKPPPPICECGCDKFRYEDEVSAVLRKIRNNGGRRK